MLLFDNYFKRWVLIFIWRNDGGLQYWFNFKKSNFGEPWSTEKFMYQHASELIPEVFFFFQILKLFSKNRLRLLKVKIIIHLWRNLEA